MGRVDYGTLARIKRCKSDNFRIWRAIFQKRNLGGVRADHGDGDAAILRNEDRYSSAAGQVRLYITKRQQKICNLCLLLCVFQFVQVIVHYRVFYKLRWKLPAELKISHTIADADGMGD